MTDQNRSCLVAVSLGLDLDVFVNCLPFVGNLDDNLPVVNLVSLKLLECEFLLILVVGFHESETLRPRSRSRSGLIAALLAESGFGDNLGRLDADTEAVEDLCQLLITDREREIGHEDQLSEGVYFSKTKGLADLWNKILTVAEGCPVVATRGCRVRLLPTFAVC